MSSLSGFGEVIPEYGPVPVFLNLTRDVNGYMLNSGVLLQGVGRHVLAETRAPESTMWHLTHDRNVVIDPDRTRINLPLSSLRDDN